jgi:hypothetical protein
VAVLTNGRFVPMVFGFRPLELVCITPRSSGSSDEARDERLFHETTLIGLYKIHIDYEHLIRRPMILFNSVGASSKILH